MKMKSYLISLRFRTSHCLSPRWGGEFREGGGGSHGFQGNGGKIVVTNKALKYRKLTANEGEGEGDS